MNPSNSKTITYITKQISTMMYGFGDSHEPNPETVRLVEDITCKQLRTLIKEALKYAQEGPENNKIREEHLVFLLRHNKYKMQRLVRYIQLKELRKRLKAVNPNVTEIDPDKPVKNSILKFIEEIDETGEFMDSAGVDQDETKLEIMLRADRITRNLNQEKYKEFQKARCASFKATNASFQNIINWIDPDQKFTFIGQSLDILSYFAFQTVSEIVDYALLVREDAASGIDPLRHLSGSYYTATMFNAPHRFEINNPQHGGFEKREVDCTRIHTNQAPISVNEIKEVMRRVFNPQAGKLNFGGKVPETHYLFAL